VPVAASRLLLPQSWGSARRLQALRLWSGDHYARGSEGAGFDGGLALADAAAAVCLAGRSNKPFYSFASAIVRFKT